MYDYEIKSVLSNGQQRSTTYQQLIKTLGLADEVVCGAAMKEGGTPQAIALKGMLETALPGIKVSVFFRGNQIA